MKILTLLLLLSTAAQAATILTDTALNQMTVVHQTDSALYSTTVVDVQPGDWTNLGTEDIVAGTLVAETSVVSLRFEDGTWSEPVQPEAGFSVSGGYVHIRIPTNGTAIMGAALIADNQASIQAFHDDITGWNYRPIVGNSAHEGTIGMGTSSDDSVGACDADFDFGPVEEFVPVIPDPDPMPSVPEPKTAILFALAAFLLFRRSR